MGFFTFFKGPFINFLVDSRGKAVGPRTSLSHLDKFDFLVSGGAMLAREGATHF